MKRRDTEMERSRHDNETERRGTPTLSSAATSISLATVHHMADLTDDALDEQHFGEIETVLLYISDARRRAARAGEALTRAGAPPHLIDAVKQSEASLADDHRVLMQGTHFAVPGA